MSPLVVVLKLSEAQAFELVGHAIAETARGGSRVERALWSRIVDAVVKAQKGKAKW